MHFVTLKALKRIIENRMATMTTQGFYFAKQSFQSCWSWGTWGTRGLGAVTNFMYTCAQVSGRNEFNAHPWTCRIHTSKKRFVIVHNQLSVIFSCSSRPAKQRGDTNKKCFYLGSGSACMRGARHSGAPMLHRYETTSALFLSMACCSAELPQLQGR